MHLATTQERLRADHLWRRLGLSRHFDTMHASWEIGEAKPSPGFYCAVEERSGFTGSELLLIDDAAPNVDAARAAGWAAHLWTPGSRVLDLDPC